MMNIVSPADALRRTGVVTVPGAGATVDLGSLVAEPAGELIMPTVEVIATGTF